MNAVLVSNHLNVVFFKHRHGILLWKKCESGQGHMPGFYKKVNLSAGPARRRTLAVANPDSQAILRICITFGHH